MHRSNSSNGCDLISALGRMFNCPGYAPVTTTILIRLGPIGPRTTNQPTTRNIMADPVQLQVEQEFVATISGIVDADGDPTRLDGPPVWETSDDALVDLRVADDGLSAIVGSLDLEGAATITVRADGRHGPDVVELIGVLSVIVAPADAVVFDFAVGEVTDRTA